MNLTALIAALVAFFEPIVQQWLADLLKKLQDKLAATPASSDAAVAVHDVFTAARAELGWWSILRGRGRVLDVYQRLALARAQQLMAAAMTGKGFNLLVPSVAEREMMTGAA